MATGDQVNIKPAYETVEVPCEGQVGDLFVMSRLREDEPDGTPLGLASLWLCTKSSDREGRRAIWQRVTFDGYAQCDAPVGPPPQDRPRVPND